MHLSWLRVPKLHYLGSEFPRSQILHCSPGAFPSQKSQYLRRLRNLRCCKKKGSKTAGSSILPLLKRKRKSKYLVLPYGTGGCSNGDFPPRPPPSPSKAPRVRHAISRRRALLEVGRGDTPTQLGTTGPGRGGRGGSPPTTKRIGPGNPGGPTGDPGATRWRERRRQGRRDSPRHPYRGN